jgi:Family of unknown function (DUF5681)
MPFAKGRSGNPGGRSTDKPWRDALMLAINRRAGKNKNDPRWLTRLAEQLVECAAAGDVAALKEIGDRLDGKPHQSVDQTLTGANGLPLVPAINVTISDDDTRSAPALAEQLRGPPDPRYRQR